VPYEKVKGVGFYRQFLNPSEWPEFMRAGREAARSALEASGTAADHDLVEEERHR